MVWLTMKSPPTAEKPQCSKVVSEDEEGAWFVAQKRQGLSGKRADFESIQPVAQTSQIGSGGPAVMAGFIPAIHVLRRRRPQVVDARAKPVHDGS
jgi:hypothetical protein